MDGGEESGQREGSGAEENEKDMVSGVFVNARTLRKAPTQRQQAHVSDARGVQRNDKGRVGCAHKACLEGVKTRVEQDEQREAEREEEETRGRLCRR